MDALEHYFTENFTYDLNVAQTSSIDSIEQFLFEVKAGYCEQFATAFTAMARSLGIPTRVAIGFQSGKVDAAGIYHVTNKDAHAWPEVYFAGYGWLPFEPTPGRFEPTQGRGTGSPTSEVVPGDPTTTPTTVNTTPGEGGPSLTVPHAEQSRSATCRPGRAVPRITSTSVAGY